MKAHKNSIAILLLVLFSCMQCIDLHAFAHDAEEDGGECHICKMAFEDVHEDFAMPTLICEQEVAEVFIKKRVKIYTSPAKSNFLIYSFLSKPPPSFNYFS